MPDTKQRRIRARCPFLCGATNVLPLLHDHVGPTVAEFVIAPQHRGVCLGLASSSPVRILNNAV